MVNWHIAERIAIFLLPSPLFSPISHLITSSHSFGGKPLNNSSSGRLSLAQCCSFEWNSLPVERRRVAGEINNSCFQSIPIRWTMKHESTIFMTSKINNSIFHPHDLNYIWRQPSVTVSEGQIAKHLLAHIYLCIFAFDLKPRALFIKFLLLSYSNFLLKY